jgi:YidC/Oxa1 family membrane protein insertase
MKELYYAIFYQPIFNLLIGLYSIIPGRDIGVAIILLTVVVKLILWPMSTKALRSQKALADLQPKVEELKKQYKDKQEELAKALMALYSQEKVSPFSSCLPVLIQLPVFIALYQALSHGLKSDGFERLYAFMPHPGTIDPSFLGIVDLSASSPVLAILAGITQYFQAKMMITSRQPKGTPGGKDEEMLATMNKQMLYMMPILTVVIGWTLPGGLALYWFVMNGLTIIQQKYFFGEKKPAAKAA